MRKKDEEQTYVCQECENRVEKIYCNICHTSFESGHQNSCPVKQHYPKKH